VKIWKYPPFSIVQSPYFIRLLYWGYPASHVQHPLYFLKENRLGFKNIMNNAG